MAASILAPTPDAPKANPNPNQSQQSRRELAASLLGAGFSVSAAARQAGVHRATIYAWLEDPNFNLLVENSRAEHRDAVRNEIHDVLRLALDGFRQLLSDPKTPPSVRLRASIAALNQNWQSLNFLFMNGVRVPDRPDHWLKSAPESTLDPAARPTESDTIRQSTPSPAPVESAPESDTIRRVTPFPAPKSDTIRHSAPPPAPQPDTIRQKTTPVSDEQPPTPAEWESDSPMLTAQGSLRAAYGIPEDAPSYQLLDAMIADSLRHSK